jgi:hypothetical protein
MTPMQRLILIFLFTLTSWAASARENSKPVFIHAACDGKISLAVLSSFREAIHTSQKYELVPTLDDNGRMDVIVTIYVNCAERNDTAALATIYGIGRCFANENCRTLVDGISIRSNLCDSNGITECGRAIFKTFDDYMSSPLGPPLRLN